MRMAWPDDDTSGETNVIVVGAALPNGLEGQDAPLHDGRIPGDLNPSWFPLATE